MKYLVNFFATGLGDRLRYPIKRIPYLKSHFNKLDIYAHWPENNQCEASFLDLFENVYNIKFVEKSVSKKEISEHREKLMDALPKDSEFKTWMTTGTQWGKVADSNAQKVLKIKKEISDEILNLQKKYQIDKSIIGIHLRVPENFDFKNPEKTLNKSPNYANGRAQELMWNLDHIEKNYDFLKNKRVLLFSDSKELIKEMLLRYDNFLTIDEFEELPIDRKCGIGQVHRSKKSVVAALKVAGLLSLCDYQNKIKLKLTSNFSKIPMWIKIGN